MIKFIEHNEDGYASRTYINASADVTIALAIDFTTAGEKLTKQAVKDQHNLYIPIKLPYGSSVPYVEIAKKIFDAIVKENKKQFSLNIAGNGIYTFRNQYSQSELDELIYYILSLTIEKLSKAGYTCIGIRSGGQTGIDESALKAAVKIKIPALCLAPKRWKFRNTFGQDVYDEKKFKARFE